MPKRGPKTDKGKAVVRLNAVRHAVLSQTPVIPEFESEQDWQAHRTRLFDDLDPHGALEEALVERIALTLWQHQRLVRFQVAAVIRGSFSSLEAMSAAATYGERRLGIPREEALSDENVERRLLACLIPPSEDLAKIMRYEAHLNRQLYQAMHELEALKARRQGQAAPLARLDIQASAET
jgi:hypothetical protein